MRTLDECAQAGRMVPVRATKIGGFALPALGLGTSRLRGDACRLLVEEALHLGYRLIDTAESYRNEAEIGRALAGSGVAREDVVLCTKVHRAAVARDAVREALEQSLARLGTNRVDLVLLHWPCAEADLPRVLDRLAEVREAGLARAVGLSNAPGPFLDRALACKPDLTVDQVERHLLLQQPALTARLEETGTLLMAYRPTAGGEAAAHPSVREIARRLGVSPHQVALRWHLEQSNVVAVAGATSVAQLRENLGSVMFRLDATEMALLSSLDVGRRTLARDYGPIWPDDRIRPG